MRASTDGIQLGWLERRLRFIGRHDGSRPPVPGKRTGWVVLVCGLVTGFAVSVTSTGVPWSAPMFMFVALGALPLAVRSWIRIRGRIGNDIVPEPVRIRAAKAMRSTLAGISGVILWLVSLIGVQVIRVNENSTLMPLGYIFLFFGISTLIATVYINARLKRWYNED